MENSIIELEKKYQNIGLYFRQRYLLLTPQEALRFLGELIELGVDRGIWRIDRWYPHPEGGYYESAAPVDLKISWDKDYAESTYREAKEFLEEILDDPSYDRLLFNFESNTHRNKRLKLSEKKSKGNETET